MKTRCYILDDKHLAIIEQVAREHGGTSAAAALRFIIDEYIATRRRSPGRPRPPEAGAETEERGENDD